MNDLLSALGAIFDFGWDLMCLDIPGLDLPFWTIPVAGIAVSLALSIVFRLVGSEKAPPELSSIAPQKKK